MTYSAQDTADTSSPVVGESNTGRQTTRRFSSRGGVFRIISFDAIAPGLGVRITRDGHLLALDFLAVLANGDRKKASQTLARIASKSDIAGLLTFRRMDVKQKSRKLVSFSNAVQLLLVLPKRTVSMDARRAIAGILTDYFEYRHQQEEETKSIASTSDPSSDPSLDASRLLPQFQNEEERRIARRQAYVDLTRREVELERQRARLPLDRLVMCMELMARCGPMSEEEQRKFKTLISEHAMDGSCCGSKAY